jgi:hypothetical protein
MHTTFLKNFKIRILDNLLAFFSFSLSYNIQKFDKMHEKSEKIHTMIENINKKVSDLD